MALRNELFAVKLYELQKTYDALLNCIETMSEYDLEELFRKCTDVQEELRNDEHTLKRLSKASKLPLVSELAGIQLNYYSRLNAVGESDSEMESAEKAALYAEYMMDSAMYTVKQAMLAALKAVSLQNRNEVS